MIVLTNTSSKKLPRDDGDGRESGFTLLEVIVALAILTLALSVLLGVISDGLRRTSRAADDAEAVLLARSLLASVGAEIPLREGQVTGRFANGPQWRLQVERFDDGAKAQQATEAYKVSAEVFSDDNGQYRSTTLSTLRLGVGTTR
jgi:general secretion pathway protein I